MIHKKGSDNFSRRRQFSLCGLRPKSRLTPFCALAAVLLCARSAAADPRVLDDFEDLGGWISAASEGASIAIATDPARDGAAMRIDFDLPDTGGWVIVRKEFDLTMPANFAFAFDVRGDSVPNNLEFKLIDPGARNVWWRNQRDFEFPIEWQQLTIRRSRVEFAWGPLGGQPPKRIAALEIAISTGSGGKGTVWIDNLTFEEKEGATEYTRKARLTASSSLPDRGPERILDGKPRTSWKSERTPQEQWVMIDFQSSREYGGLLIDWDEEDYATAYRVEVSDDAENWTNAFTSTAGNGGRDYIYMPDAESRYLRLRLERSAREHGYGIVGVTVEPFEFSLSPNEFFQAVALDAPVGTYPKYLNGMQTYWTVAGVNGDSKEALLNEEGMLEVEKEAFSIEPFLYVNGLLIDWSQVATRQELAESDLPIPTVTWRSERLELDVTAFGEGLPGASTLHAIYRVENRYDEPQRVTLFLAVRPFQVSPPWQALNMAGGVAPIREIAFDGSTVRVNRDKVIIPSPLPARFGAATFEMGSVTDFLLRGDLPPRSEVVDSVGFASGALAWDLDLPPGSRAEVFLTIPFHDPARALSAETIDVRAALEQTRRWWRSTLDRVHLDLPLEAGAIGATVRSTLAYILINRDGPRIQPGSRNYARSWIRDGALTSAALLEMGFTEEVREFLRWYARYQPADGRIPCCVDDRGADPLPEHDSHGQFIYAIAEYYRFTRDVGFVTELWPNVVRAVEYIRDLRGLRTTEYYRHPSRIAFFGLLPESVSHEGYSARPVHSYWDDFFALKGLKDAVLLAEVIGDEKRVASYGRLRDAFQADLYASIAKVMEARGIKYLPASADLADFDPSATAAALLPGGELANLPAAALRQTFDRYWEDFSLRRGGDFEWESFSPYEIRAVSALLLLGQRDRANEVLDFMMQQRRPLAWNQWSEILWRSPTEPRWIGDMPHTWVGSGFIQAVRLSLAYERERDRSLVLAAGVPRRWITDGRHVAVERMPTHFGILGYHLRAESPDRLVLRLSGHMNPPPGGIIVRPPLERPLTAVSVNGRPVDTFTAEEATFWEFPAEVVMESGAVAAGNP